MIWVDERRWGTAAEIAAALGPDVTATTVRWWARHDGLTAVRSRDGSRRPQVHYPLDEAARIEAAKRSSGRGRPRRPNQGGQPVRPGHDTVVAQIAHSEEMAAMQHGDIVSATITFRYEDGSSATYEIHEGASIRVDLSRGTRRDPGEPFGSGRRLELDDRLNMALDAHATGAAPEFVTYTRSEPGAS